VLHKRSPGKQAPGAEASAWSKYLSPFFKIDMCFDLFAHFTTKNNLRV
jgi:hypothetical protein